MASPSWYLQSFCLCPNCYTISWCTVCLNCSTASQIKAWLWLIFCIFFLSGLLDLFAWQISISRAPNRINGCLDTEHQHTDISHMWCFFWELGIHSHSNWVVKLEKEFCKTWVHEKGDMGVHLVAGGPFFEAQLERCCCQKVVIRKLILVHSWWGLCSHIWSDLFDWSPSDGIHLDHTCSCKSY